MASCDLVVQMLREKV